MDTLNQWLQALDKLQDINSVGLVFITCIVVGYALRFIRRFPNDGIPLCVILWGALFMMFLADARPTATPARVWEVRNFLIGLVVGFVAWIAHKTILAKIEALIGTKIADPSNTTFFNKPPTQPPSNPSPK